MFGAVNVFAGIIGALFFGYYVQKSKKYKRALIAVASLSLLLNTLNAYSYTTKSTLFVTLCSLFVGLVTVPVLPIGFELAVELTYPIEESYSAGLLMSCG